MARDAPARGGTRPVSGAARGARRRLLRRPLAVQAEVVVQRRTAVVGRVVARREVLREYRGCRSRTPRGYGRRAAAQIRAARPGTIFRTSVRLTRTATTL
jgi:hypothetical protein